MRKKVRPLLAMVLAASPVFMYAALVPCNGPDCQACHIVALGQNIIEWLITAVTFVIVLVIIAGGFQMVTSGGDPGAVTKARGMITNAIVGLVIMLLAWLIIDTVLKMLLDPAERGDRPWSEIVCIDQIEYTQGSGQGGTVGGGTGVVSGGMSAHSGALCNNSACSPSALEKVGYTPAQAKVMSCIAMTESSGNPSAVNPNGGACGTFQILPSNWRNPALHTSSYCANASCQSAACNAEAAFALSQGRIRAGQSPYGDWTCPNCNSKAAACVQKYDPSSL